MNEIILFLSKKTKIDFSDYKEGTIKRRLQKRMSDLEFSDAASYLQFLKKDRGETKHLLNTILIGVTRFFRDPKSFEALRPHLEQKLAALKEESDFRIWSIGCASGEEAYSLAILLSEINREKKTNYKFKIFASDLSDVFIKKARKGLFTAQELKSLPVKYQHNYFEKLNSKSFRIRNELKQHIIFSQQNVLTNPPFITIDLISCRNLLIYFNKTLQQKVYKIFQNSLNNNALLFLGKSESFDYENQFFDVLDQTHKIYKLINKPIYSRNSYIVDPFESIKKELKKEKLRSRSSSVKEMAIEALQNQFFHPYLVINEKHKILEKEGKLNLYLDIQDDLSHPNLLQMINEQLYHDFFHLFNEAKENKFPVRSRLLHFTQFKHSYFTIIEIKPFKLHASDSYYYIVIFESVELDPSSTSVLATPQIENESEQIHYLKDLVQVLQEQLNSYNTNLQKVVVEAKLLTDDLQSVNEELKSSNEELETSNEELQSANEELFATNIELNDKNFRLKQTEDELIRSKQLARVSNWSLNLESKEFKSSVVLNSILELDIDFTITYNIFLNQLLDESSSEFETMNHLLKEHGESYQIEVELKTYKQNKRWLSVFGELELKNGKAFMIHGYVQDISQQKLSERRISESESKFKLLAENTSDVVTIYDKDGKYLYISPSLEEITDYTVDELMTSDPLTKIHPDDQKQLMEEIAQAFEKKEEKLLQYRYQLKSGNYIHIETISKVIFDSERNDWVLLNSSRDVSDRILAEEKMRKSEEKFRLLAENSLDIITLHVPGKYLYISPSAAEVTDYSIDELMNFDPWENIHPEDLSLLKNTHEGLVKRDEYRHIQYRYRLKSGDYIWLETTSRLIRNDAGETVVLNSTRDINKRKIAEENLKQNQAYLNAILESPTSLIVFSLDTNYCYKTFNSNHKKTMKAIWSQDIEVGKSMLDYIGIESDREKAKMNFDRALLGEEFYLVEEYGSDDLKRTFYEDFYSPTRDENGEIDGVTVFVTDISDIMEGEKKLVEEKERLLVTLRSIGDGVITTTVDGTIEIANDMAEDILRERRSNLIGKHINDVFHVFDLESEEKISDFYLSMSIRMQKEKVIEKFLLKDFDQKMKLISIRISPIYDSSSQIFGVVIVFHDISDQERIQRELQKSQKLESIGILAGGIAHDFNNILTGMLGHISLMKILEPNEKDDLLKSLDATERACDRAQKLTKQLLTFSKGGSPIRQTVFLDKYIIDACDFALRGSNIKAKYDFEANLSQVDIDVGQFEQVINNLAINAMQAMPNGGSVIVKTSNFFITSDLGLPLSSGPYVKLDFTDNGHGIDSDKVSKIFDPFFTTKKEGSGLGLATSYSIISKHDGYIDVYSELNIGTSFHIYLPASKEGVISEEVHHRETFKGQGTVLILDDQTMVQDVMSKMLERMGFDVLITSDGEESLEVYIKAQEHDQKIDLFILDVTIPGGKGGLEVLKELKQMDPNAKVIISSGYSSDEKTIDRKNKGYNAYLAKPFSFNEFNDCIESVLNNKT